jgi:hypothetical protein
MSALTQPPQDAYSSPAWLLALAGASAVAWARCLSLIWGNSFYAVCALIAGSSAALAWGNWISGRTVRSLDEAGIPRGIWLIASGLLGLSGLVWLRFIGINAGSDEHLFLPLRGAADFLFIAAQSALACALWLIPLPLAREEPPADTSGFFVRAEALPLGVCGPWAAWWIIPWLGAAPTAAVCHIALLVAGIARIGPRRLAAGGVLSGVVPAGLALALALGLTCRSLFTDVWLNRLNAALPGGRYLALAEDGREFLALYRFSSGATVLLRDGAAWANASLEAKREAHLPLLMHGSPHRVLICEARNPATLTAALSHNIELVALDSNPGSERLLRGLATEGWPPPSPAINGASVSFARGDIRRHLRARGTAYDVIIVELPFPALTPEWSRLVTAEAFQELRGRLAPEGIAALRLPAPYPGRSLARALRTARSVFAHVGGYDLAGGYLLVCSDSVLTADPATLLARRDVFSHSDDMDLDEALPSLPWTDHTDLPPAAAALSVDRDDRPSGLFSLSDRLWGPPLARTAAEALR